MIKFRIENDLIIATYKSSNNNEWIAEEFDDDSGIRLRKSFNFNVELLLTDITLIRENIIDRPLASSPDVDFKFAEKYSDEYFKIINGILVERINIYICKDVKLTEAFFVGDNNISLFNIIAQLINEDVYIGGSNPNSISAKEFLAITKEFPTQWEKKKYSEARVTSVLKHYFSSTIDGEGNFESYRNKKISNRGQNLLKTFKEFEIIKFQTIYDKLKEMLYNDIPYSEHDWQNEIIEIIRFLFPKYISVFKSVKVEIIQDGQIKSRFIDLVLVDADGNIDIIEIKKPFDKDVVMSPKEYRNNYIPLKELSGTVMQIEKYIYYLNRWSEKGEEKLTKDYKDKLPPNFKLKITNPNGMIIMGRENNMTKAQKMDFEVVKRKYKNVIDILTYDNLLERLKFTIEQMKRV